MIHIDTLSKTFSGGKGLDRVSLHIKPGEMVALIGSSGSGKSTLMRHIAGLMPGDADGGRIEVAQHLIQDRGVISRDIRTMRAEIGMVFQQPTPFRKSIRENILFAPRRHGRVAGRDEADALVEESLRQAALWDEVKDKLDRSAHALSGGQQQRVLLARALCAADRLLILDEPVTGLDPAATQDLYKTLRYLNEKEKMAVIMVTHDMRGALREAHTILHIGRDGWFFGTVAEYLASPAGKRFGGAL